MTNYFYRLNENGNAVVFNEDGEQATTIDSNVYPVGSSVSARYDHPNGIILTVEDAENVGILAE